MMRLNALFSLALFFLLYSQPSFGASAQQLYVQEFGESANPALLFLHGGPGFNCVAFEVTTAEALAKSGFYVLVYDRRGEGRSEDTNAKFTFEEACNDVLSILDERKLTKVTLMGHSFGGVIAVEFSKRHPERVANVVLVGAPISLQESFSTIIGSCKKLYSEKQDSASLKYIAMLESMDKSSLEYSTYCFMHAKQNGFYQTKNPTDEAKAIREKAKADPTYLTFGTKSTNTSVSGFWKNEHYTTLNLASDIEMLVKSGIAFYAMYGQEDGLYSQAQVQGIEKLVSKDHLVYWDRCSHNVFIDRQTDFLAQLKLWLIQH